MGSKYKIGHCFILRLSVLMLVCYSPLSAQFLTGTIGLRSGFCHGVLYDQENKLWVGAGQSIGFEIGVNLIPQLELITTIAYLSNKYIFENDEVIYYKVIKEYTNLHVPLRVRLNPFTSRNFSPNIEIGVAVTRQYSGYSQLEYQYQHPIAQDDLETDFGLLCGLGAKVNIARYLSAIPSIHYQRNSGKENANHLFFSLGISYGG